MLPPRVPPPKLASPKAAAPSLSPKAAASKMPPAQSASGSDLPELSSFDAAQTAQVTKIQAGARGHLARKQAASKQQEQRQVAAADIHELPDLASFSKEDTAKLTKIQAGARGHLERKHAADAKSAQNTSKPNQGGKQNVNKDVSEPLRDLSSYSDEEKAQLVKIQAAARGGMARKKQVLQVGDHHVVAQAQQPTSDLASFSFDDEA